MDYNFLAYASEFIIKSKLFKTKIRIKSCRFILCHGFVSDMLKRHSKIVH